MNNELTPFTACFTGHRTIPQGKEAFIFNAVRRIAEDLIRNNKVRYFGTGGAIGFDTIAAQAILSLKDKYDFVKLIVVCPCKNQDAKWSPAQKKEYKEILEKADKVVFLSETYYTGCMQARNRHLVDNSTYCISYLTKETGGTAYTVRYAKEKGLTILSAV